MQMNGSTWESWRPIPIFKLMELTEELKIQIEEWNLSLKDKSAREVIAFFLDHFQDKILLSTSLGLEDQVLTEMVLSQKKGVDVFTLDTGRLFPETYDYFRALEARYGLEIEHFLPDPTRLATPPPS